MKHSKQSFCFCLLSAIQEHGENIKVIQKKLGMSRQALDYHIKKLKRLNMIEQKQKYPYSVFSLTPLGETCKKSLGQSDTAHPLWRCHNLILGFDIKNFGSLDLSKFRKHQMKNWYYVKEEIKDSLGAWVINIHSTGLLKIYCPEIYYEEPKTAFGSLYDVASRIAQKYQEIYGMKLGLMRVIREGHKELVRSEKIGELLGNAKTDKLWADKSTGSLSLEEPQSSEVIETLLSLPEHVIKQTEIMSKFTKQMALHLSVQQETKDALQDIRDAFKEFTTELKKRR